jgi:chemotaxis protein methyltransferase CheR
VHSLFYDSLATFGVLVLGSKETLRFMSHEESYQQIAPPEKIFRKIK